MAKPNKSYHHAKFGTDYSLTLENSNIWFGLCDWPTGLIIKQLFWSIT